MLLVLPALLLGHVAERRAIDGLLGKVRPAGSPVSGQWKSCRRRMNSALCHAGHEAGEKLLLLGGERAGGGHGGIKGRGFGHGSAFSQPSFGAE